MLTKLIKHELQATGRIMLPLFLLLLVTAVGGNLSSRVLLDADNVLLNALGFIFMLAFALAIVAVCLMACALMVYRFYKSLLQDEGYVMMTLPVSVHQHVISKLLVSMLWFVLSFIVVAAACIILAYHVGIVKEIAGVAYAAVHELFESGYTLDAVVFIIELLLLVFFGSAFACLHFYLALSAGHSFSSRKLLWSVVSYFAIQLALNLLTALVLFGLGNMSFVDILDTNVFTGMDSIKLGQTVVFIYIAVSALKTALFYFPTVYFLRRRLNLE